MSRPTFLKALIPAMVVVGLVLLFVRLGFWQLDRARQKHEAYILAEANAASQPVSFADIVNEDPRQHLWRPVTIDGEYLARQDIALDNQSLKGEPGYLVYTPFKLNTASGSVVLVNRGWLRNDGHRENISIPEPPAGEVQLLARIGKAPSPGLLIAGGAALETLPSGVRRVQRIDYQQLRQALRQSLYAGVLLLESNAKDGLTREWHLPGSDEARHQSYAFQWFAMATALVIAYVFAIRRQHR